MIYINGEVNGRVYDQEKVSLAKFKELFGIDFGGRDIATFETSERLVNKDRFGQTRKPMGFRPLASTRGTIDGAQVEITYATSVRGSKDNPTFRPRHLPVPGGMMTLTLADKEELAAFFYVHEKCENSPFGGKGEKYFTFFDPVESAQKKLAPHIAMKQIYDIVFNDEVDRELLLSKAAGMGVSTYKKEYEEIQSALMNIARSNPVEFVKNYEDSVTTLNGLVKRAIDAGIIKTSKSGASVSYFISGPASLAEFGQDKFKLADVPFGVPGAPQVVGFLLKNTEYIPKLSTIVRNDGMGQAVSISDDLMSSSPAQVKEEEE